MHDQPPPQPRVKLETESFGRERNQLTIIRLRSDYHPYEMDVRMPWDAPAEFHLRWPATLDREEVVRMFEDLAESFKVGLEYHDEELEDSDKTDEEYDEGFRSMRIETEEFKLAWRYPKGCTLPYMEIITDDIGFFQCGFALDTIEASWFAEPQRPVDEIIREFTQEFEGFMGGEH